MCAKSVDHRWHSVCVEETDGETELVTVEGGTATDCIWGRVVDWGELGVVVRWFEGGDWPLGKARKLTTEDIAEGAVVDNMGVAKERPKVNIRTGLLND